MPSGKTDPFQWGSVSRRAQRLPLTARASRLVCEILSTSRRNDLVKQQRTYHRCQMQHYWILDPTEETLAVHRWSPDGYVEVLAAQRGERVRAEPFDAVELDVGVFFGDESPEVPASAGRATPKVS